MLLVQLQAMHVMYGFHVWISGVKTCAMQKPNVKSLGVLIFCPFVAIGLNLLSAGILELVVLDAAAAGSC